MATLIAKLIGVSAEEGLVLHCCVILGTNI